MNYNAQNKDRGGILLEECTDLHLLRKAVEELFCIIDDIDTAGDSFKPEITPYTTYVMKKSIGRGTIAFSDGYELFIDDIRGTK